MNDKILVVDDQPAARRALASELEEAGFEVVEAADGRQGWERFRATAPAAVVTDLVMPGSDGLDLLGRIRAESEVPVILFSAHGSIETAVSALKVGADDFISTDDFDVERLVQTVRDALDPDSGAARRGFDERLVGSSPDLQAARRRLEGLAPLRVPVLLVGEPGSGRATAARALHDLGASAGAPYRRVEAEDFRPGAAVDSLGAVLLHHVERLPTEGQAFWLERLRIGANEGSTAPRLLASSREPLALCVAGGDFDAELAERLSRFEVRMPPLREHLEDLPELVRSLLERAAAAIGRRRVRLSPSAMGFLGGLSWVGNVAELERVLERALAYSRGRELSRRVLEDVVADLSESLAALRATRERVERDELLATLRDTGGNVTRTADLLGRSRSSVYRLIEKHGIRLTRDR